MKIDLHIHTAERSHCGRSTEEEQARAAIDAGLDAIVFTDHTLLAPPGRIRALNDRYPDLWILGGIELTIDREDVIVLGVQDRSLETEDWTYPALRRFVADRGGFIAVAHPFRYHDGMLLNLEAAPPDAIEVYSCSTPPETEDRIRSLAADLGIPVMSNSDSHRAELTGRWYNELSRRPASEAELIDILKAGDFDCYVQEEDNDGRR